jgi:hypothetical protein
VSTNHDEEELELQALQRQLDDAFETTRPRPGYDDELWLRVQAGRLTPRRLRDMLAGLLQGIRSVPAVPASAVAAVLVVVVVVVAFTRLGGFGPGGGGGASTSSQGNSAAAPAAGQLYAGNFGRLPTPVFNSDKSFAPGTATSQAAGAAYSGPVQLVWSGKLTLNITSAPVFRYREPSANAADQFATGLGAVLHDRPSGFLGSYSAADYTLKVRGTVQSPPSSPAYFIFASLSMPPIDAAGAGPADQASIFLAQHGLIPQWSYVVEVDSSGDPVKVRYDRQFDAPGYGPAYLVDLNGQRYGLEVDLSANRPVLSSGLLPVSLEIADYQVISADEAVRAALASSGAKAAPGATPAPTVQLTQAELVYVLVPAGDHSFYEPAVLFSGSFTAGGQTLVKRVLVPAVDPSQRRP